MLKTFIKVGQWVAPGISLDLRAAAAKPLQDKENDDIRYAGSSGAHGNYACRSSAWQRARPFLHENRADQPARCPQRSSSSRQVPRATALPATSTTTWSAWLSAARLEVDP